MVVCMYVMRQALVAAILVFALMASGGAALAQGVPAEIPSANFRGDQYVDSRGCAFVRVGLGGNTQWVPRVGRDRRQICGLSPSGGAGGAPVAVAAPRVQPGITVIGGAASAPAQVAPAIRSVATQPRPPAAQPRHVATTPRPAAPAAAQGACPNLPADIRGYFTGANVRCGPQAVHPGDAARGAEQTSALGAHAQPAIRQLVRYQIAPPPGYRAAWDDGRLNPYRGLAMAGGQRQMEQVWTNTVPRRLVGSAPRGMIGLVARDAGPATLVPARLVIVQP